MFNFQNEKILKCSVDSCNFIKSLKRLFIEISVKGSKVKPYEDTEKIDYGFCPVKVSVSLGAQRSIFVTTHLRMRAATT